MANKSKAKITEELENTVTKLEGIEIAETVNVEDAIAEPIKEEKVLVTAQPVKAYKIPTLNSKYETSTLTPGVPYVIIDEITSNINGKFYKIHTGEYVSALSNITVG